MQFEINDKVKKKARWPHDLFVLNIFFFHLLLTPATILLNVGQLGLLLPLALSGSVIGYIYFRSRTAPHWFVAAHWKLAFRRCKLLLGGYMGSAVIFFIGWLVSQGAQSESMQSIMFTVFTRIAIMPTLIMAMITVVLEASATGAVSRGEIPDVIAKDMKQELPD